MFYFRSLVANHAAATNATCRVPKFKLFPGEKSKHVLCKEHVAVCKKNGCSSSCSYPKIRRHSDTVRADLAVSSRSASESFVGRRP